MKKIFAAILAIAMIMTASFGTGANLESLYKEVYENSSNIEKYNNEIALYDKEIIRVDDVADTFEGDKKIDQGLIEIDYKKILNPLKVREEREKRIRLLSLEKETLELDLKQKLSNRMKYKAAVKQYEQNLDRANKELETAEKKLAVGQITENALNVYKEKVLDQEALLRKAKNDLQINLYQLNLLVGRELKDMTDYPEISFDTIDKEIDLDKVTKDAIEEDVKYLNLLSDKKCLEKDIEILKDHYFKDNGDTIADKEKELIRLNNSITNRENELNLEIYKAYNNLMLLKKDVEINELKYNNRVLDAKIVKSKFDLEIATSLEKMIADEAVFAAHKALEDAKNVYASNHESFRIKY